MDLESGNELNDGTAYDLSGTSLQQYDTDGDGRLTDIDGFVDINNDGIDDRASRPQAVVKTGTGGCTLVSGQGSFDPMMWLLLMGALLALGCRRRSASSCGAA